MSALCGQQTLEVSVVSHDATTAQKHQTRLSSVHRTEHAQQSSRLNVLSSPASLDGATTHCVKMGQLEFDSPDANIRRVSANEV